MAKTLILMRHGKACAGEEGQPDFDRELSEPGRRSLKATLADSLAQLDTRGSFALWSSPAIRAMQTAELLKRALDDKGVKTGDVVEAESLWDQDEASFLQALSESDADTVFAVGHNPFVESLTEKLTGAVIPCATGGLVCIRIDTDALAQPTEEDAFAGRLFWFAQGPVSQDWKTLVQIEETLKGAEATMRHRLEAFMADPDDIETMHKFRVSIRTLRSLVAFVKPWQQADQNAETQALLKGVVAHTSRLRELDVFAQQAAASQTSSAELVEFCEAQAAEERARVKKILESKSTTKALKKVHSLIKDLKWKRRLEDEGLPACVVRARFDALVTGLEQDLEDLTLADVELTHDVRKKAKRARYAAENFKPIVGADAVGVAKGMTAHQDNLGAICDARVNIDLINGFLEQDVPEVVAWDLTLLRAQNEMFLYTLLRSEQQDL